MASYKKIPAAEVILWGNKVGAVAWNEAGYASFQYEPDFIKTGIQISPLVMPLSNEIYAFPALNQDTFHGLPGLLSDSLPDRFGNSLIEEWLLRSGRDSGDFTPVERLCYMDKRGMGALEYKPSLKPFKNLAVPVEIDKLAELTDEIRENRKGLDVNLEDREAFEAIIRIGTSAGGARAKAVIAWNPETNDVRSGQFEIPKGFEAWILKFDGANQYTLGEPAGYGKIEFSYYEMALKAGIRMNGCRLYKKTGRSHFMTRRFDRNPAGGKIHMQSLCSLKHFDYNSPREYSYEQVLKTILELRLDYGSLAEMFRRIVFNVVSSNCDDHTRNISFLMDPDGQWSLSPAYDLTWSYNSESKWTSRHQLKINGKSEQITRGDVLILAEEFDIREAKSIIDQVNDSIKVWPETAEKNEVDPRFIELISKTHHFL